MALTGEVAVQEIFFQVSIDIGFIWCNMSALRTIDNRTGFAKGILPLFPKFNHSFLVLHYVKPLVNNQPGLHP